MDGVDVRMRRQILCPIEGKQDPERAERGDLPEDVPPERFDLGEQRVAHVCAQVEEQASIGVELDAGAKVGDALRDRQAAPHPGLVHEPGRELSLGRRARPLLREEGLDLSGQLRVRGRTLGAGRGGSPQGDPQRDGEGGRQAARQERFRGHSGHRDHLIFERFGMRSCGKCGLRLERLLSVGRILDSSARSIPDGAGGRRRIHSVKKIGLVQPVPSSSWTART
jgi:hypothetical protein